VLKGLQWPVVICITKYAFIALQTPGGVHKYCDSYVCVISLSVSKREYLQKCACDLYQILGACCLWLWFDLPPAKGRKSAIYDCLVSIIIILFILPTVL